MFCFGDFNTVTSGALSMRLAEYLSKERNHLEKSFSDSGYGAAPLWGVSRICAIFSNNSYAVH
jgi:hypothetical protein